MAGILHSDATSLSAPSSSVSGNRLKCDLRDEVCAGNFGTEFGSQFEEVVPDSDDEDMRKEEVENEDFQIMADSEDHQFVADSDEDCNAGCMKTVVQIACGSELETSRFATTGVNGSRIQKLVYGSAGDGIAKLPDGDKGKYNGSGSQQTGESSQAYALKFVDQFLMANKFDLSPEDISKRILKEPSPPSSCSKGVKDLAQKIRQRTSTAAFDWSDSEPTKQGGVVQKTPMLYYSRRRKRFATTKPVITTMKALEGDFDILSNNKLESHLGQELPSIATDAGQSDKISCRPEEVKGLSEEPQSIGGKTDKEIGAETSVMQRDTDIEEEGTHEMSDDVFDTQMAAEVIEALSFEVPITSNGSIRGPQININICPRGSIKEAQLECPSLQNGNCYGERLKHRNRTGYEQSSRISVIPESEVKRGTHLGSNTGFRRKKLKPFSAVSEKWSCKTVLERKGNETASKRMKEVHEEPYLISMEPKACGSSLEGGVHTGLSTSLSPSSWMSASERPLEQKKNDITKDVIHTYKRRSSVLKENRTPNLNFSMADVRSSSPSKKGPKIPSAMAPFCSIKPDTFSFVKGKRTTQISSNFVNGDGNGHARSKTDFEKEVKYPSANKCKQENQFVNPAWIEFSRKKRTTAASKKQIKNLDLSKAKVTKRSSSECVNHGSCVGDEGKIVILEDSNELFSSDGLTSVSSNDSMVQVGSVGSVLHKKKCEKWIASPFLTREVIQLDFSNVSLDFSCKNLRQRKHVANIHVLLSQHLDNDTMKQQKKILARLGISVASSASHATHFVANTFLRTRNMLEAIALGRPVVTQWWLESCAEAGCLVDEKNYILRDAKKEKEIGFSLSTSLDRANRHPLLKDRKVLITPNIKPSIGMISDLVKAVQGELFEMLENDNIPEDVIILSCEEDYALCMPFINKGIPIHSCELLMNGIVVQKLELQRHRLFSGQVKYPRMLTP